MDDDDITRAANARKGSPFLTTEQAGRYIALSGRALEKMRRRGGGPRFRKHGRYVRYHIDDLDAWSAARSKSSFSDPGPQEPAPPREGGNSDA